LLDGPSIAVVLFVKINAPIERGNLLQDVANTDDFFIEDADTSLIAKFYF